MSDIFIKIMNMSVSASWMIIAVILIRLVLRKAPKWSICLLWGMVALRLVIPFSFKSVYSLIPSNEVIPENITEAADPHINTGIVYVDDAINPVMEANLSPQIGDSANPMQTVIFLASLIWSAGVLVCLLYALISYIVLKMKVRASKKVMGNVYACDEVKSPFILGVFRPFIYIPSGMDNGTTDYVIAHENAHLKRGDHFWKPLGFIFLSVYWFNPLCWVAYILLCRDIEFACDERVIRDKDSSYLNSYSRALLDCNTHRKVIAACPLAFGEAGVKDRIKNVLNYKTPAFWVTAIALLSCIVMVVCFLTDPKKNDAGTVKAGNEEYGADTEDLTKPSVAVINTNLTEQAGSEVYEIIEPTEFAWPTDSRFITSGFDNSSEHPHTGTDFPGEIGSPVYAVCDGKIEKTGFDEKAGNYIVLTCGAMKFTYKNLDTVTTGEGNTVKVREQIGTIGNTGLSTGPHLHIEYESDGILRDFMQLLTMDDNSVGVTMTLEDVGQAECGIVFVQSGGTVKGQLQTGAAFDISKQNEDGTWDEVPYVDREYPVVWNEIAYQINLEGETVMHADWKNIYGELPGGSYRLHKQVMDFRGPDGGDVYDVYADFVIPESSESETDQETK